ncbi:TnsA endonuclease N-terminal domain-containing protein [Schinkia azotoformans]|uniref:TnsA endonuclease N-terminal domain-containing protein n=1 Tax=Schinkia azotoformans TaxID=1454 RepID=UPI002DBF3A7E|nr:TnsA endonuclease N-terminal domain-containing protein [Schinkia azotoformans]MEC1718905.1 TnsA endonuclease N-terminal domain-containing protein [Schinkia azotoformans]MED4412883.1 TnsA endonuclease N-terminal domain-containing protein [Schinkia azotoformans]
MKQIRKIKPSKKGSYRGFANSRKCAELVAWESLLERDFIKVLDFDPLIEKIQSQPVKIEYRYKGKLHNYYPDFLAVTKEKYKILYEVKPDDKIDDEQNKVKFEVGKIYCAKKGWNFNVVSEEDIRKGYFIQNLDLIRKVDERSTKASIIIEIYNFMQESGKCKIGDLRNNCSNIPSAEFEANIYYMIYNHYFEIDLINELLSEKTLIDIVR